MKTRWIIILLYTFTALNIDIFIVLHTNAISVYIRL